MVISTGSNGFHLFKPAIDDLVISEKEDEDDEEIPRIKESEIDLVMNNMSKMSL